ncbi:flagellar motor protein MotB [Acutalibacter caecimuris]|uniref:flagellar motor protein MotB n=1 Tax=Acutalibacter caecimuris TaxID=3093657 RepID=UPI002AC91C2C|nr:flagellar motor protein MotB [Acutalibacter sp. M00118]
MRKKSGGGEGGGANWMDTYGDMVTLLLCFFVLLYSMSTVDEEKWKAAALSFNPNALSSPTVPEIGTSDGPFQDPNEGEPGVTDPGEVDPDQKEAEQAEIDVAIDQLYQMIKEYVDQSGKNVEITKGDGYVYLSFADSVFFSGDSYELLSAGRQMLDTLAPMLDQAAPHIDEVRIMGHTAQASASEANTPVGDRMLAAERAAQVTAYLQEKVKGLDPGRMVSEGFGQHRPVAPNDVEENRKKNRRVEMIISGKNLLNDLGDCLEQYDAMRSGEAERQTSSSAPEDDKGGTATSSAQDSATAGPASSSGEG